MIYSGSMNDKMLQRVEKAIVNIESVHQNLVDKPFALIEKSKFLSKTAQPAKLNHKTAIEKFYRGLRDLTEAGFHFNNQISELMSVMNTHQRSQ
ncbi:hypothetical protein OLMES_3634 [Oleiphilus messinensis]|uniref:Uncharacterized protein n=1 Tax=Oleiphilus messinensis TaxID=141451 RepID=A0A1Y0IB14_9GAMM|nr:hypothetical protein [Oleiphilus messinensis]ARU57661.1 hypothetical protein OLMES_3634 [Oleiphilus messinensis]